MKRLWKAFWYSMAGFKAAWTDEPAFRQEVILSVFLIPTAFIIAPDGISLILMIGSLLLLMALELLNTAVEAAINRFGGEIHPLSKKAKDTASAAVLMGILVCILTWGIIILSMMGYITLNK